MTTKQIQKLKSPKFIQQIESTLKPLEFLDRCAKDYGDIFFTNSFGNLETLVVSHPQDIQELFNPVNKILDAPGAANEIFKPHVGENSLIMQDGERHQKQRKLVMPPFHGEQTVNYGHQICEITQQVMQHLKPGETFIARHLCEDITMTIMLKVVFGIEQEAKFEKLKTLMTTWLSLTSSPIGASILLLPFLQKDLGAWSPWGRYRRLRQQIDEQIMTEILERRQQVQSSSHRDILSLLIQAGYDDGESMTDIELRDNLLTLLNAGHETTATSIAWALYWIHQQPEFYHKVLHELQSLNTPDPVKIAQLPYLTAICQETLRIYPVSVFTFPRITLRSVNLRGYHVASGTYITPCIYLTHHREDLYPQPEKFQPERFINRKYSSYEFLPFGGGSRQCLGQVFALFEMKLILATMLLNYQFKLEEFAPVAPTRRGFLISPQGGVKMSLAVDTAY
ncbi:cytochrome P450 [Dulcicalothrix desertica PCC 7102]|uniref:Cytochrome P450 n=1 Tax=Dulcicalothrix desertica PCC 7102 TaxID=232991 RepID=A0A433VE84_9CYAN|nr:cytochrome P450 [Dulcicalothrix desertica]RUT04415.1 cytochrome P450 [Dulcicalothrix desertica PCC 7102]TWH51266.1 cytochrome P450 [Dulcicalothrix desertica PCC 7102]